MSTVEIENNAYTLRPILWINYLLFKLFTKKKKKTNNYWSSPNIFSLLYVEIIIIYLYSIDVIPQV